MSDNFIIAVASGKGGTGKTTIATNLALTVCGSAQPVQYLDCDVEEPNGNIFLKAQITKKSQVTVDVPQVEEKKCIHCGKCGAICQYGAIVCIKENVLTFEQLCHSCGGCRRVCPSGAITTKQIKIGEVESGKAGKVDFVGGRLKIGHVRTPSLIKHVKEHINQNGLSIIDVPPGTSCPVVESLKGVNFVLLVTEPTPFGLNDLKLAVDLVRKMNLPFGVAINRDGIGNDDVERYCQTEGIEVILKLPDDRRIAEAYSNGQIIADVLSEYKEEFSKLYENIKNVRAEIDDKR